jgi:hypothetical protein
MDYSWIIWAWMTREAENTWAINRKWLRNKESQKDRYDIKAVAQQQLLVFYFGISSCQEKRRNSPRVDSILRSILDHETSSANMNIIIDEESDGVARKNWAVAGSFGSDFTKTVVYITSLKWKNERMLTHELAAQKQEGLMSIIG